jgi:hypothetical protein
VDFDPQKSHAGSQSPNRCGGHHAIATEYCGELLPSHLVSS